MRLLLAGSSLIRRLAIVLDFMRISWVVQAKGRTVIWMWARTLYPFILYVCVEPQAPWMRDRIVARSVPTHDNTFTQRRHVSCPNLDGNPRF